MQRRVNVVEDLDGNKIVVIHVEKALICIGAFLSKLLYDNINSSLII